MTLPVATLFAVLGFTLLAVVVVMATAFTIGTITKKYSVIDAMWGPGFVVIAWVAFAVSAGHGDTLVRWIVVAAVTIWGLRLGGYILLRNHGLPEDGRYIDMLKDVGPTGVIRKVQVPQGLAMWFVSLPVQLAMVLPGPAGWGLWVGVAVWLVGIGFEAIGDAQLAKFKSDPANKGQVMNRGLWRYTRHPNYFGDATLWWGIFLMVSWSWIGWLTILWPAAMTYLIVAKTGKALTEKRMSSSKPGYAEYVETTSGFLPLPPRKK
ncbi:DUF1295 domain-containing protein [Nakamurella antarctica]|uniref:DUF1295 domain-containing protein n=1 Tax=Nakamurella antarctica TaxID=1902245 RepID=A0A3G8ZNS8_9ACTN|nr:DUF1295 domain-containing protein [Nakamurella antarctica]AZI58900.1 DUF1295 domain-containing protein [Nakamurella antarctica]